MPPVTTNWKARTVLLVSVWCVCVVALVLVGDAIVRSPSVTRFDEQVTAAAVAERGGLFATAMRSLTWLGAWPVLVVLVVALVVAVRSDATATSRRLPPYAVVAAIVAVVGEELAVRLTKEIVARSRPPTSLWLMSATGWSFPSGHVANAVVWWGTLAFLVTVAVRSTPARVAIWGAVAVVGTIVAVTRVTLGVHWGTDVVASAVFAAVWLAAVVGSIGLPALRTSSRCRTDSAEPGVAEIT